MMRDEKATSAPVSFTVKVARAAFWAPGLLVGILGCSLIIVSFLPVLFTTPPGADVRPMGWAVLAQLLAWGTAVVGAPLSLIDVVRTVWAKSEGEVLMGCGLGIGGLVVSLYALVLPTDVLWAAAYLKGWTVAE